jgi:hypothetical protein
MIKTVVFDDWKSVIHAIAGGLGYFFPLSLSYSFSMRLQSTSSFERTKHSLSATLWSSVSVTRSSDCYMSLWGGRYERDKAE